MLRGLLANHILWAALTAWLIAQVLKMFTSYYRTNKVDFQRLVGAGGMPSSHAALVVSLAMATGWTRGFESVDFAIAVVMAGVVMYDASGVRQAAGKQAKVLNKLLQDLRQHHTIPEVRLKELLGHTPLEVIAGAVLGTVIAWLFCG